jgi:hypothetical protein
MGKVSEMNGINGMIIKTRTRGIRLQMVQQAGKIRLGEEKSLKAKSVIEQKQQPRDRKK